MFKKVLLILVLIAVPGCIPVSQEEQIFGQSASELSEARKYQRECVAKGGTTHTYTLYEGQIRIKCKTPIDNE